MECFFKEYQYTFSALGSIATAAAVWIALRRNEPKARIVFSNVSDNKSSPFYQIEIINKGTVAFKINRKSFIIKIPFSSAFNIFCYEFHASKVEEPLVIDINDSIQLNLTKTGHKMYNEYLIKQIKEVNKFLLKFAYIKVVTKAGDCFRVKMPNNLMEDLKEALKEARQ